MVCINSSFVMIRVARRFLNLSACQSQNGLPWSIIKPYGSIRVNLTEAVDNGWTESEDFPDQLKSMLLTAFLHRSAFMQVYFHIITIKDMQKSGG